MLEEQGRALATLSENEYTHAISQPDDYRTPLPAQVTTYELTAPQLQGSRLIAFDLVKLLAQSAAEIPFEQESTWGTIEKRLIERQ